MPTESFELAWTLPVPPGDIYRAWLDSKAHGQFTGGIAQVAPGVGGQFTAWDGYIQGTTLELEPDRRIVQSWRTKEFPSGSGDSRIELLLEPAEEGTRVTLRHTEIPEGQGERYRKGWGEFYIQPMTRYFREQSSAPAPALEATSEVPTKKGSARKAAAKKGSARKAAAKKDAAKKGAAKKAVAKKAVAKKGAAKKGAAKKAVAKKGATKKGAARKVAKQRGGQKRKR